MMNKPEEISIFLLADVPQHLKTVAGWIFAEWGHLIPGLTDGKVEEKLRTHLNRSAIPLSVVAISAGQPVGTASLMWTDMSSRSELSPWLASVFVAAEFRKRGIGSELVKAIEAISQTLQVQKLYLFTPDQAHFYTRLGWSVLEEMEYRGEHVVVMVKSWDI
jgi:N-acetylglutamate synthase-like GNAT family acetyltransferase